ncbi:MAG: putative transrane protein [Cyanobacteria bacterium RYN_339]|nr:putative transrane protein [Cyanobacteria bacterium RYN_339]
MAGIGFTLRRMLQEEGYSGPVRALTYAAIIAAGPWITSSGALAILSNFSALPQDGHDFKVFLSIISYVYAFSLVGVGVMQMGASRYLADRLYAGEWQYFAPAFAQLLAPLMLVQGLVGLGFMLLTHLPTPVVVVAVMLYLAVNGTWVAMIFLTAAKDFRTIVIAFVLGFVLSVCGGIYGGAHWGLPGQLGGFTAGYVLTFFVLVARIKWEFGLPIRLADGLGAELRRFWPLAVTGWSYNMAIWIDKIMFWYHPEAGEQVAGPLHVAPIYDNAMFLAYVTIVPALGMFLLRVETDFYDAYRAYFSAISAHDGLVQLRAAKREMAITLVRNLALLLKVQGPVTLGAVVFAPELIGRLHLTWLAVFVFRFGAIGSCLHVAHLMILILLLYLDFRLEAMFLGLVFLTSNWFFTLLSFQGGLPFYGLGYAFASAFTLGVGLILLWRALRDLEYHIFMRQPLT